MSLSIFRVPFLLALSAGILGAQAARLPVGNAPSLARFDWFAYEGNDPVYKSVKAGPNEYLNPILQGFYPDPSIVRVGDDYYVVTSSFAYFPGVPIFHSQDLVHWEQIGHVLDRPSQLKLDSAGVSRGIFAPAIRHHAGVYYMITTLVDAGGTFFVTATNPAGPWSEPVWLPEVDGIDPSIYFEGNRAWVLNNGPPIGEPLYEGHRAIWIQEFDVAAKKMIGPRSVIVNGGVDLSKKPIWIEAPHIFKREGKYYLICAEGGTADQHSEVVFRSDSVGGPYVPWSGNPILTQRHLDLKRPFPITTTGHADFVETPNGEWWAVFLGTRTYGDDLYNTGRETFLLPVRWVDGWPVITAGTELVPYVHARPSLPARPVNNAMRSGNFSVRDDFEGPGLPLYWSQLRTPRESPWYDLTSTPGSLTIRARKADIGGKAVPSFLGRRQQHAWASASTAMTYRPTVAGDRAGLVVFQNEEYYYFLGVALVDGAPVIQLQRRAGARTREGPAIVASRRLTSRPGAPIYLKIQAKGSTYDFFYAYQPDKWILLEGGADGTMLSTKIAGGFVGAMFGLYAYSDRAQ
jgi:xylan 1,4-beta-xylosidase